MTDTAHLGELEKKQSMRKESKARRTLAIMQKWIFQKSKKPSAKTPRARVPFVTIKVQFINLFLMAMNTVLPLLPSRNSTPPLPLGSPSTITSQRQPAKCLAL